jgi:hypothetical protein
MSVHGDHDIAHLPENELGGVTSELHYNGFLLIYFHREMGDGFVRSNFHVTSIGLALDTVPEFKFDFGHVAKGATVASWWWVVVCGGVVVER